MLKKRTKSSRWKLCRLSVMRHLQERRSVVLVLLGCLFVMNALDSVARVNGKSRLHTYALFNEAVNGVEEFNAEQNS